MGPPASGLLGLLRGVVEERGGSLRVSFPGAAGDRKGIFRKVAHLSSSSPCKCCPGLSVPESQSPRAESSAQLCPLEAPRSLGDQWLPKNLSLPVAHRQCPKCRISPLFSILELQRKKKVLSPEHCKQSRPKQEGSTGLLNMPGGICVSKHSLSLGIKQSPEEMQHYGKSGGSQHPTGTRCSEM